MHSRRTIRRNARGHVRTIRKFAGTVAMRSALLIALSVMIPVCVAAEEKSDTLPNAHVITATKPRYNWDGFYFGGHVSLGLGKSSATLSDTTSTSTSNTFGGPIGGVQLG